MNKSNVGCQHAGTQDAEVAGYRFIDFGLSFAKAKAFHITFDIMNGE